MKRDLNLCVVSMIMVVVFAVGIQATPKFIHYNGILMTNGAVAPDGNYSITFRIYEAETGGADIWSEIQPSVSVNNGKFHVKLGEVVNLNKDVFSTSDRWLGVEVDSDGEMVPRSPIGSVPYAFMAASVVDKAIGQDKLADKAVGQGQLGDKAVGNGQLADKAVGNGQLDDKAVGRGQLDDKAVGNGQLDDKAVGRGQIDDKAVGNGQLDDEAVTTVNILNSTILFEDIAPNDAVTPGAIMKWDGTGWSLGSDEGGGTANGWTDDGTAVRLVASTDNVAIGMDTPGQGYKLDVLGTVHSSSTLVSGDPSSATEGSITVDGPDGIIRSHDGTITIDVENLNVSGKATIGSSNINAGSAAFVAGDGNQVNTNYSVVSGGSQNQAGQTGGVGYSTVTGGFQNVVRADYSTIVGGFGNTIIGAASYSYLFGYNSTLTQDNTFMVDMDRIWFGKEATGYAFPTINGSPGQVMSATPTGQLTWADGGTGDVTSVAAGNGLTGGGTAGDLTLHVGAGTGLETTVDLVQLTSAYADGSAYDARFINDQTGSVTTTQIANGTLLLEDLDGNGATVDQIMKFDGSLWSPANDETGGWVDDGTSVRLSSPTDFVGIGISTPLANLHVSGTTMLSGVSTIANNQYLRSGADGGVRLLGSQGHTPDRPAIGFFSTDGLDDGGGGNGIYRPTANTMAFATASTERMRITVAGWVGLGTTTPHSRMCVAGDITPDTDCSFDLGSSSYKWNAVYACNGTIQTSDMRLKRDVQEMDYGLSEILRLRPVTYKWKAGAVEDRQLGLIAQEVKPVIGEVVDVGNDEDQTLGIRYANLVPVLIKSIQELKAENDALKASLKNTDQELASLLEKIEFLVALQQEDSENQLTISKRDQNE